MDGKLFHTVKVDGTSRLIGLFRHKVKGTYSFVNMSTFKITECEFNTIEDAVKDLDNYVENGKLLAYRELSDDYLKYM